MSCAISLSVVRTRKGSPALEHRSPSEAQMPGCTQLLRPLLYRPFPSWFRFHIRACRGRMCSAAESSLGEGCRGWCRGSLRVTEVAARYAVARATLQAYLAAFVNDARTLSAYRLFATAVSTETVSPDRFLLATRTVSPRLAPAGMSKSRFNHLES